jgi:hypothetical protein
MGLHDPFEYLQHKLWLKEGQGVKVSIWLSTIKSQESPWTTCVKVAHHILLESFQQRLQFFFRPYVSQRFTQKIMGFQSCKSSNFENFETLDLGVRGKWHLGATFMANHREYYMGEGGGFPQVRTIVSLVNLCMFIFCLCIKNAPTMHSSTCCLVCACPCE